MKARDRTAVAAYRTASSAIDNAEAVPLTEQDVASAIESSAAGAGRAEEQRRSLTEADMVSIVLAEVDEIRAAEVTVEGDPEAVSRLHRQARLLEDLLAERSPET